VQKNPTQATLRFTLANFEAEAASPLESGSEEKQALLADAEENYKKLVDSPGMSTEVLMRLGTVQRMLKRNNEALASFERAAKASPGNAEASLNEAMVLESLGQQEQARKVYTQTLGIDPGSVVALNNLAYLNADANRDLDQAMTYAERAKKRVPNNPNISDTLGYVYYRKNLTEEAIRELETAVNGDPKNANYRLHLAMALLKRGDKAGAKREAENALRTANTDQQDKIRSFMSQIG
jgi:Flp pilus assembly protein TadD